MKFSTTAILAALLSLSLTNAAAFPQPEMGNTLVERQNAGRPVASGNCCIANTSKKEDICKTLSGAEGKCVPEGAQVNCNGALNCIASSLLTCDANKLENGRPTCRL